MEQVYHMITDQKMYLLICFMIEWVNDKIID
jgi:hypothetical protein